MRKRLLDFLACPTCKGNFQLKIFTAEGDRIKEGLLSCPDCEEFYPVVDFIPRIIKGAREEYADFLKKYDFSPKEGQKPSGLSHFEKLNLKTKKSFGYQWTRRMFSHIIPKFKEDFLSYIYPIDKDFFQGKIGVDIGCGFGRHIYYAAKFKAEMLGVDFSHAIDLAYRNTEEFADVHLIQADIYSLPLKNNCFDFVYSIGVMHHLPDPERGFNKILSLLKPRGCVFIWVYSKSRPVVNFMIEQIRLFTKNIHHKILYPLCLVISFMEWLFILMPYKAISKFAAVKKPLDKIVFRRIKIYSRYPFAVLCADWFDRLSAPIRYYYNEDDLRRWFARANLNLISISRTAGYGWRALGQKL